MVDLAICVRSVYRQRECSALATMKVICRLGTGSRGASDMTIHLKFLKYVVLSGACRRDEFKQEVRGPGRGARASYEFRPLPIFQYSKAYSKAL